MDFKGIKEKWEVLDGTSLIGVKIGHAIFGIDNINEEAKANALLISKAPEMLEMLNKINITISIHGKIDSETELHYQLNKLIKEATEL